MYERLLTGGNITLFSPDDVPDLYEAFYADQDKFKELYIAYENRTDIRKKVLSALEVFSQFLTERKDTGRIYLMNVDHANSHGSFIPELAPIRMSNLCTEIDLPTKPLKSAEDIEGEISLCTLSATNFGLINEPREFEKYCDLQVRALDALLDYQKYPVPAAEVSTKNRRPLGNGIINLAYFLAKRGLKYDASALPVVDEYTEAWSYYLIKASVDLAKEKGACPLWTETKYSLGLTPNQTYKKEVDELVPHQERMDWESLRAEMKVYGIRNSTLMALMPAETSAQISNSTNGIEPPKELLSVKRRLKQIVPQYSTLKHKYTTVWEMESNKGYFNVVALIQKFFDQAISANWNYNPEKYPEKLVPMSEIVNDWLYCYKMGHKTAYYLNTYDGATDVKEIDLDDILNDTGEESCDGCTI
jgi:ribonucleoside-diphosphate reductase alpha chain